MTLRVIGVEEQVVTRGVLDAGRELDPRDRDLAFRAASQGDIGRLLLDVGDHRLVAMTATGLDVQVLSLTTPGMQNLPDAEAVSLQQATNDMLG